MGSDDGDFVVVVFHLGLLAFGLCLWCSFPENTD
jgi:hypothetical protein